MNKAYWNTKLIGPFAGTHKITIDGFHVPHIEAHPKRESDSVDLVLDGRFSITATQAEVERWGWFLAQAMAIAAGYSSHGEDSRPTNRYKVRLGTFGEPID